MTSGPVGGAAGRRLGVGLLWQTENGRLIREEVERGRVGFVEVIAESLHGGDLPSDLDACRRAGAVVVPHGVGLGLGGAQRPDRRRLRRLARAAEVCHAALVSEHVAFVRAGRVEAGHLLPVPRTRAALDVLVANVRRAEAALPVPLALEPIAALADWPAPELDEAAFLIELLDRTGVDLALDLANLHVNAANRRRAGGRATGTDSATDTDAAALMASLPADRIAYVHVAGGTVQGGRYHDTHTHPLWPEVATLVEELWARTEPPGLLLERETRVTGDDLDAELSTLEGAIARGRARRPSKAASSATTTAARSAAHPPARSLRRAVGASQAQLLRALSGRSAPPPGFARADIDAIADVLAHKRADAVRQAVPELAVTRAFRRDFLAWAGVHALACGGPARDARRFFRWLHRADRTTAAGAAITATALRPDRWPIRAAFYRTGGRTVVGVRIGRWQIIRRPPA